MVHEIAASDLEITNIVNPLRKLLRKVEVLVGGCGRDRPANNLVVISRGYSNHLQRIDYDHLVIALDRSPTFTTPRVMVSISIVGQASDGHGVHWFYLVHLPNINRRGPRFIPLPLTRKA